LSPPSDKKSQGRRKREKERKKTEGFQPTFSIFNSSFSIAKQKLCEMYLEN